MYKLMSLVGFLFCFYSSYSQNNTTISPCIDSCCNLVNSDKTIDLDNRDACNTRKIQQTITTNLRYPVAARDANIEGLVFVSFQINTLGQGENFKVLNDIGGGCGQEALRLVKLLFSEHEWQYPDVNHDELLPITYNVPVRFSLRD